MLTVVLFDLLVFALDCVVVCLIYSCLLLTVLSRLTYSCMLLTLCCLHCDPVAVFYWLSGLLRPNLRRRRRSGIKQDNTEIKNKNK